MFAHLTTTRESPPSPHATASRSDGYFPNAAHAALAPPPVSPTIFADRASASTSTSVACSSHLFYPTADLWNHCRCCAKRAAERFLLPSRPDVRCRSPANFAARTTCQADSPLGPPCRCLQETHRASPTAHLKPLAKNQPRSIHLLTVTSKRSGRAPLASYPYPYPLPYPLRLVPPCCCPPYPVPCRPPVGLPPVEYEACRVEAPVGRPEYAVDCRVVPGLLEDVGPLKAGLSFALSLVSAE